MPSTTNPRIIARNRKNAQRSTGPRTSAGKAVSRGNSLKHGLTANPAVGVTEDAAAFDGLLEDLCRRIGPLDAMELSQVRRIAVSLWRLQRAERIETAAARQAVAAQTPLIDRVQAWVGRLNTAWFEVQFYEESDTDALAEGRARCIAPRREPWRRFRRPGLMGLDALRQNELMRDVAGIDAMLAILDDLMALPTGARPLLPVLAQQLAWLLGENAERFTAGDLTEADREGRFYPDERPWATHTDKLIGEARKRAPGAPVPLGLAARAACCKVTLRQQRACLVVPGVDEDLDRRLVAMLPSPTDLERLIRYETHADRTLSRALETLARLRGVPVQTVLARVSVRHADGSGYEVSREESVWGQGAHQVSADFCETNPG